MSSAKLRVLLVVGAVLLASCKRRPSPAATRATTQSAELKLERALPIDINDDFQPSGLALLDGRLLTVSDKDDAAVYEIVLGATSATLRTFIAFTPPPDDPPPLDLEGIAIGPDDSLLLASESRYRILRVDRSGQASWATPSLEEVGHRAGLFQKRNANLEGIARLADGRLLLAAEREPRGLIELPANGDASAAKAWAHPTCKHPPPPGRDLDFADLAFVDGDVYALERNTHLVVRLEATPAGWDERDAWSYASTENDPRFAYRDTKYGVAEGLAIDREHVFIVMDNNRLARASDPSDRRPLLLVFTRPAN